VDFKDQKIVLRDAVAAAEGIAAKPEVAITYGNFLDVVINFVIVAFAVFLLVKAVNSLKKKEEAAPAPPPGPTADQKLLTEIRDLLRARG